jgi:hypothetical protein
MRNLFKLPLLLVFSMLFWAGCQSADEPAAPVADATFVIDGLSISGTGLYVLDLQSDGKTDVVVPDHIEERSSSSHPLGNWVAYQSSEFGTPEVFVVDYPTTRPRQRITIGGGRYPQWSPDGRWIYFKRGTSLFRVAMSANAVRTGEPEFVLDGVYGKFLVLPDGSGILTRNEPDFRQIRLIQGAIPAIEDQLTLE